MIPNIDSSSSCCLHCRQDPECRAWTWGKVRDVQGLSDVCFLKGLTPDEALLKLPNRNTTSGLPFRTADAGEVSLFCFSPVLADENATQLMLFQHRQGVGIFSCEEQAIYSTKKLQLAQEVPSATVDLEDAACEDKDSSDPCTRTSAITEVWKKVVIEGRFRFHKWTAKVSFDTMFIAHRLKSLLDDVSEPSTGLYLNSCRGCMHAPVTVMSRIAIQVFGLSFATCTAEDDGDPPDEGGKTHSLLTHQCLSKLEVAYRTEWSLLSDSSCASSEMECKGRYVAYHPFGTIEEYSDCLSNSGFVPKVPASRAGNSTLEDAESTGD